MIICLILVALICLYQIQFSFSKKNRAVLEGGIYNDYLSLDKTNSIKGIFIILVLFSHASSYLTLSDSIFNKLYLYINFTIMEQGIVSAFLFYSGYAMMLSGLNKGKKYIRAIPKNRIFKTLYHFDIAVIIFAAAKLILGESFSIKTFLLSLIGWESLGNSNWYIFAILVFYFSTYIAFLIGKDNKAIILSIMCVFTIAYLFLMHMAKGCYWYDTSLLYLTGMFWCVFKDKIEYIFKTKKILYYIAFALLAAMFVFTLIYSDYLYFRIIKNTLFGLIVIMLTMKIQVHNKILNFFGRHLFSIYIIQRLPMNTLERFGVSSNPILFVILSFVITMCIAIPFDKLLGITDKLIFGKKKKSADSKSSN